MSNRINVITLLVVGALSFLLGLKVIAAQTIVAQTGAAQTAVVQTTIPQQVLVIVTPTSSLEQRIDALNERTKQLEDPNNNWLEPVLNNMWPLIVILIIAAFYPQIRNFLNRIVSSAHRTNIEIAGVKYSVITLNEIIVQREILKMGILIATADNNHHPKEFLFLENISASMNENLEDLDDNDKLRVFQEAVNMAASDGTIQDEEYTMLKQLAQQFQFPDFKIDIMVINKCIINNIHPPEQLKHRFEIRKKELEQEVT